MSVVPSRPAAPSATLSATTRTLLLVGAMAGPVYVVVGAVEAATRDGFDITRHSLSLLGNGDLGWVHMTMMVLTGVMTVVGAFGLTRVLDGRVVWVARLVGLFGLGVAVAGLFRADPMDGFPPGTPAGRPAEVSASGLLHLAAGGIGFLGLIAACLLAWRWFRSRGAVAWARFSLVTGVVYLVTFVGIASGAGNAVVNLAFTGAVVLGWAWITLLLARARSDALR
jgi:hypothetical protein